MVIEYLPTMQREENADKILNSLMEAITSNNPLKEKLKQVKECLDQGAEIDAVDATNNNNTPLHVAAINGEVQVVELLLAREANASIRNSDNHTVFDIAQLPDTPNGEALFSVLQKVYGFQKRSGTSGISGHLYETKLLALILLRFSCDDNIKEFIMGTNIVGMGNFDDIILKYKVKGMQKSKIIFIQAKHRDGDTLTVEELLNPNAELSLQKYFRSYLAIKQKFVTDNINALFRGSMKNIDVKFVIYTSAQQYFTKNKNTKTKILVEVTSVEEGFIETSEHGKIFKFKDYKFDDFESFVSSFTESRTIQVAKIFSKFLLEDNCNKRNNMMLNDLMKTYHLFLAHSVIQPITSDRRSEDSNNDSLPNDQSQNAYYMAEFRPSFLISEDNDLLLLRRELFKEIAKYEGLTLVHQQSEEESILKTRKFRLPVDFGDHFFTLSGSERKQLKRINHLCSILQKLFENYVVQNDSKHIFIKIDDDSIGPGEILESKDFEIHWLGGLVGNLLINDIETEMLKINLNKETLSNDSSKILQRLESNYGTQLSQFRFVMNINNFPKLKLNSLHCKEYDRKLVRRFLSELRIFTNQAKEDEVERIIINEIPKLNLQRKQRDSLFLVNCNAIFMKVHDDIQKWWKQPAHCGNNNNSDLYLTKSCDLYEKAAREILNSPLLNIIHYTFIGKIKNIFVEFEQKAINSLRLELFLNSVERMFLLVSNEVNFTSMKVIQYFEKIKKEEEFLFLDLECEIIETYLGMVNSELECSVIPTLIVICRENTNNIRLLDKINTVIKLFKGKIIILAYNSLESNLKNMAPKITIHKDCDNNFRSLTSKVRKVILEQRELIFQGVPVTVNNVLQEDISLDLLSSKLLSKIINGETVVIGKALTDNFYTETANYYVNRKLCRFIILKSNERNKELCFVKDDSNADRLPQKINDIVLITESKNIFAKACERNTASNIHWFINEKSNRTKPTSDRQIHDHLMWKQTRGSLQTILKYVDKRLTHQKLVTQPETLKDLQEKVVIIGAEPGMGKSTLLTHLALNTKRLFPSLWILKINLLSNSLLDHLSDWKQNKTKIDLKEVIKFLYSTVSNIDYKSDGISELVTVNHANEICLNDHDSEHWEQVDMSEIKLFNYFYNNNNLAIVFDGFDEFCPKYENEVIQLLCTLKISKVAYLWITSRPYSIIDQLELALGTFSHRLMPLSELEQEWYLKKVWTEKLVRDETLHGICKGFISKFLLRINDVLDDINIMITSSPLHLYMISVIYQDFYKNYIDSTIIKLSSLSLPIYESIMNDNKVYTYVYIDEYMEIYEDRFNLVSLFEKFINMKFYKIRFSDKKRSMDYKDPDVMEIIEGVYKKFLDDHKKLAAYSLLDTNILLSENDIKDVHALIENVNSGKEKTGIIECPVIDSSNPKFVHFTFADFFAVELLFDLLCSGNSTSTMWQYLIDYVLISDTLYGIRRFINSKLRNDQSIIKANEQHMSIVFNVLLTQYSDSSTTAIHVAVEEDLEYIGTFLIQCAKTVVYENNLLDFIRIIKKVHRGYCTFCALLVSCKQSIVEALIKLITDINCEKLFDLFICHDHIFYTPLALALRDQEISRIILNNLQHDPDCMVELFTFQGPEGTTAAHTLGTNNNAMKYSQEYLLKLSTEQRMKIFSVKDFQGQIPAHYAADKLNFSFFITMNMLIKREDLKKLCCAVDNSGCSPIRKLCVLWASEYSSCSADKLRSILDMVYDEPCIDVGDFIIKKFPKIQLKSLINVQGTDAEKLSEEAEIDSKVGTIASYHIL